MPEDYIEEISDESAGTASEVLMEYGRLMPYSNRSAPYFNIWAWAENSNRKIIDELKVHAEDEYRSFIAPTQTSPTGDQFPPALGIANNDQVIWDGKVYRIENIENADGVKAAWKLHCRLSVPKAKNLGAGT